MKINKIRQIYIYIWYYYLMFQYYEYLFYLFTNQLYINRFLQLQNINSLSMLLKRLDESLGVKKNVISVLTYQRVIDQEFYINLWNTIGILNQSEYIVYKKTYKSLQQFSNLFFNLVFKNNLPIFINMSNLQFEVDIFYKYVGYWNNYKWVQNLKKKSVENLLTSNLPIGCVIVLDTNINWKIYKSVKNINIPLSGLVTDFFKKDLYDYPLYINRIDSQVIYYIFLILLKIVFLVHKFKKKQTWELYFRLRLIYILKVLLLKHY